MSNSLELIYKGLLLKAYWLNTGQDCDFKPVFDSIEPILQKKLLRRLQYLADHGPLYKNEIYKEVTDGIYEVKADSLRGVFVYHSKVRGALVITHMFIKKRGKWTKDELERARARKNIANSLLPD
jgi:phage-related protein